MPTSPTDPAAHRERLITGPFIAVTAAAAMFFVYIGILVAVVPRFVENELGAGELGVGLTLAVFALAAIAVRPLLGWIGDRRGRRVLMMGGALVAGVAGAMAGFVGSLPALLVIRALTGVGEAAMFVGAATLIADLAPAHRRAEAASYFSVAVFGGIGFGPLLGEWMLADDRYRLTFVAAGGVAVVASLLVFAVPRRVDRRAAPGVVVRRRFLHPAAVGPGVVLGSAIAGFAAFMAFMPEHARDIGLSGAGGLFLTYSMVCLVLRIVGARLPELLGPRISVTIALVGIAASLVIFAASPSPAGLWVGAVVVGVGMAFLYPSLMAIVVDRVDEHQRASALSSFTMFFEVGTVVGAVVLGVLGQVFDKRVGFAGGSVFALAGLVVLWVRVVPRSAVSVGAPPLDGRAPVDGGGRRRYTPVAGD